MDQLKREQFHVLWCGTCCEWNSFKMVISGGIVWQCQGCGADRYIRTYKEVA